jgi:hypothetical protein
MEFSNLLFVCNRSNAWCEKSPNNLKKYVFILRIFAIIRRNTSKYFLLVLF